MIEIINIKPVNFELEHGSLFIKLYFHRGRNCYGLQIDKKTQVDYVPFWVQEVMADYLKQKGYLK